MAKRDDNLGKYVMTILFFLLFMGFITVVPQFLDELVIVGVILLVLLLGKAVKNR